MLDPEWGRHSRRQHTGPLHQEFDPTRDRSSARTFARYASVVDQV